MLNLRPLNVADEDEFRSVIKEFRDCDPGWTFAFHFDDRTDFPTYLKSLQNWSAGKDLGGFVPNTFLIAEVDEKIVGRVSIRHELNDFLLREGGHIGFGIAPSQRRKGYASEILKQALPIAKNLGLSRVLLTCDENNEGSWRTIEANRGVLETNTEQLYANPLKRRYWIDLT